jgi:hypothetical protein
MKLKKILLVFTAAVLVLPILDPSVYADLDPLSTSSDMLSLRDPFRRPNLDTQNERPKSDLETFPADQLKMVGVLTGPKKFKAMIFAPNGKTYFVTLNTRVGLRNGVITRITENSVLIREKVVNLLGQQEDLETALQLVSEPRIGLESGAGEGRSLLGGGTAATNGQPMDMAALKRAALELRAAHRGSNGEDDFSAPSSGGPGGDRTVTPIPGPHGGGAAAP